MKKNSTVAIIIALVLGIVIGAVGYYVYYESQMSDLEKAARATAKSVQKIGNDAKNIGK